LRLLGQDDSASIIIIGGDQSARESETPARKLGSPNRENSRNGTRLLFAGLHSKKVFAFSSPSGIIPTVTRKTLKKSLRRAVNFLVNSAAAAGFAPPNRPQRGEL
jgi:hypothetical protein